jgi:hypothetical protein
LTNPPPRTATYLVALPSDILPKYSVTQLSHVKFVSRTNLCLQVLIGWLYTVLSHWCERTLPSTGPRSDHLVTLLHLLRKCRKILQNIKSGYVILIILLVINFPNKSPKKIPQNTSNRLCVDIWIVLLNIFSRENGGLTIGNFLLGSVIKIINWGRE